MLLFWAALLSSVSPNLFSPARHTVEVNGCVEVGYYTITVLLGWPPQPVSLLLDTGSHITALPCSTCSSCGQHQFPLFNVTASSSARVMGCDEKAGKFKCQSCENEQCLFSISYSEGSSLSGIYHTDKVLFSDLLSKTML